MPDNIENHRVANDNEPNCSSCSAFSSPYSCLHVEVHFLRTDQNKTCKYHYSSKITDKEYKSLMKSLYPKK